MQIEDLDKLRLVGGTALALQIGHRRSIDVGLFGEINYNHDTMGPLLSDCGDLVVLSRSKHINIFSIDHVNVDLVNYRYPWLSNLIYEDNLRLASIQDIAAMKLNAISGRGSRKDFVDLYFLLDHFTLEEMFAFYLSKFDDGNLFLVQKSLTYFKDAEVDEMPEMIEKVSWANVKRKILSVCDQL